MAKVRLDISMSLDGYVAGPDADARACRSARAASAARVGLRAQELPRAPRRRGGESNADDEIVAEGLRAQRRRVMGRQDVQRRRGPLGGRSERRRLVGRRAALRRAGLRAHASRARAGGHAGPARRSHFVTGGIEAALEQARAVAGDKDVLARRRRRASRSSTCGRACSTRSRSTSCRSSSAPASASSTASRPTRSSWKRRGWSRSPGVTHLRFRVAARAPRRPRPGRPRTRRPRPARVRRPVPSSRGCRAAPRSPARAAPA